MKRATIKTIAKMANVSHTTVSRALNNSEHVTEKTRKKILDIAMEQGYVPNVAARGLVSRRTYLIGIFFSDLNVGTSPSFLIEVINQVKRILPDDYSFAIDSISHYQGGVAGMEERFDGVIIVSQSYHDDDFIDQVVAKNLPVVVLNRPIERRDIYNVTTDDHLGVEMAMSYALRMGHRQFGMIKGEASFVSSDARQRTFESILKEHQLTLNPDWIKAGNYLLNSGYEAMKQILMLPSIPTCVFISNDDMAIGAVRACLDFGLHVPADISIIGYDDVEYAKYLEPRLTTVSKPTSAIVQAGVTALVDMMDGEAQPSENQTLAPKLMIRDSVKKIPLNEN
ncbi:LacI family DNA-binding transcriptional regulator [Lactiplantibacillus fabifermentans]|nr:LacI family DNA-binding transcriptional regulator [Lactiplantibacillus fabifermentans]ETY73655.1 LacI family transcription regulator [Lactiplantibacillus fabifermentans T30PCM01]